MRSGQSDRPGDQSELLDNEIVCQPEPSRIKEEAPPEAKASLKRHSDDDSPPRVKRRKTNPSPSIRAAAKKAERDSSDLDAKVRKKKLVRRDTRPSSESADDGPPVKRRRGSAEKHESDGEDKYANGKQESEDESKHIKPIVKSQESESDDAKPQTKPKMALKQDTELEEDEKKGGVERQEEEKGDPIKDSSSELSDVIDEPPKRKQMGKKTDIPRKPNPSSKKGRTALSSATENADEAEIKKLQSQLVKCGVRKIWGIELKKYEGDVKAKTRHLNDMLRDIGMGGRFSEAKAREIKEQRELQADLEAVVEMDRAWGTGRASRSRGATQKSAKVDSDDGGGGSDESEPGPSRQRRRNPRAALAFLGEDSESE